MPILLDGARHAYVDRFALLEKCGEAKVLNYFVTLTQCCHKSAEPNLRSACTLFGPL